MDIKKVANISALSQNGQVTHASWILDTWSVLLYIMHSTPTITIILDQFINQPKLTVYHNLDMREKQ